MARNEIIGLIGLILVATGGAFAFGELSGRINGLGPERIRDARDEALEDIRAEVQAFGVAPATEVWEWKKGQSAVELIRVDQGICYLVEARGMFDGGGESVSVVQRGGFWHLEGKSKADRTLSAKASCWRFPAAARS